MIATYPMYSLPKTQMDLNIWWKSISQLLAERNIDVCREITQVETDLYRHWLNPELYFSQTCGYPLTTALNNKVKLVGTPVYDSQYCQQSYYCSLFIVRKSDSAQSLTDYAGKRFVYNGTDSQSGFNTVRTYLSKQKLGIPFFGENIVSGQHVKSIAEVANGNADVCAVDCVIYSLIQRHQPQALENVRILTTTGLTPGLPFITSINTSDEVIEELYNAINQTCQNKDLRKVNANLLIKGISKIPLQTYLQKINLSQQSVNVL